MPTPNLENLTTQTLNQKPSFFQRARNSLAAKLLVPLTAGTFALAACGGKAEQGCNNDYDCPGEQLCINNQCVGEGQSCSTDYDCPGDEVCQNNLCVSPSGYGQTPNEIFNSFANSLKGNNLETALNLVHPESKTLRNALSGQPLPQEMAGFNYGLGLSQLGEKLEGISLTFKEEYGSYQDYTFPCGNGYECLFRFKKDENGQWKIERF